MNTKYRNLYLPPFLFILLYFQYTAGFGQIDFQNTSLLFKYHPANNIPIECRVVDNDTSYLVFMKITFPGNGSMASSYSLNYEIKDNYTSISSLINRTINFHLHGIGENRGMRYFRINIPDNPDYNILFIQLKNDDTGLAIIKDIPLKSPSTYAHPNFYMSYEGSGLPVCNSYVQVEDSLVLNDLSGTTGEYQVYLYKYEFSPADPPMYRLKKNVSKTLTIDSAFRLSKDRPFIPKTTGLYFIQSDTNSMSGFTVRVEKPYYPRLVIMDDLIEAAIYLTTRQELNRLRNTDDARKSFEKFWLNMSGSEGKAKRLINLYYNKVENANALFTTYKQGWKTDMGMLYLIIGPPDDVYSTGDTESWYYSQPNDSPAIVFNFVRLKNQFSNTHFVLVRDKQYKSIWFRTIDEWRKGRK